MEFYVTTSATGETGVLSVIGRFGVEEIPVDTLFHAMLRKKPRDYPCGLESTREIEWCKCVHLHVHEVEASVMKLDRMPSNTTGVLRCIDPSVDLVPPGSILTDHCVAA